MAYANKRIKRLAWKHLFEPPRPDEASRLVAPLRFGPNRPCPICGDSLGNDCIAQFLPRQLGKSDGRRLALLVREELRDLFELDTMPRLQARLGSSQVELYYSLSDRREIFLAWKAGVFQSAVEQVVVPLLPPCKIFATRFPTDAELRASVNRLSKHLSVPLTVHSRVPVSPLVPKIGLDGWRKLRLQKLKLGEWVRANISNQTAFPAIRLADVTRALNSRDAAVRTTAFLLLPNATP